MAPRALNIKRDCPHGGRHKHGTATTYDADGCRCSPCRNADRRASTVRDLRRLAGDTPFIDAEPARAHVRTLMEQGMGLRRISAKAGLRGTGMLRHVIYGSTGRPPATQIRRENAELILAVTLDLADRTYVNSVGARRRLQALVAQGWTLTSLGTELGCNDPAQRAFQLITNEHITIAAHRRIVALYDRLWNQQPPETTSVERAAVKKALRIAARKQWVTALAWDDIDDPAAKPYTPKPQARISSDVDDIAVERRIAGDDVKLTRHEMRAAAQLLHERGLNVTQVSKRLRISGTWANELIARTDTAA